MKTIREQALRMATELDSGEFPEELEPQQVAWMLREAVGGASPREDGDPTYGQLKIRLAQARKTIESQRLLLLAARELSYVRGKEFEQARIRSVLGL